MNNIMVQEKKSLYQSSLFNSFVIDLFFIWPLISLIVMMDSLFAKIIFSILITISFITLFLLIFYMSKNKFIVNLMIINKEKRGKYAKIYTVFSTILESFVLIYFNYYEISILWIMILIITYYKDYKFKKILEMDSI